MSDSAHGRLHESFIDRLHRLFAPPNAPLPCHLRHRVELPVCSTVSFRALPPSTMGEHRQETWYRNACRRWSGIKWSFERYQRHLDGDEPRFPEDLFLGGAAGERDEDAWSVVDGQLRTLVESRLSQSARGGRSAEDLWGDVVLRMISDDPERSQLPDGRAPAKVIRFRGRSTLATFFYVAGLRIGIDVHRKRDARPDVISLEVAPSADRATQDQDASGLEAADRLATRFVDAFCSLPPTRRALLALVHGRGLPKGHAAALLGLKPYQVSRELKRAITTLRDQLAFDGQEPLSTEVIERCLLAWTRTRSELDNESDLVEASS
jgi:RNA polymerase sigma factor (sigma-70 family)